MGVKGEHFQQPLISDKERILMDIYTMIFAGASLAAVFFAYRAGIRDARRLTDKEGFNQPSFRLSARTSGKERKETDEERRERIALENIENYGTSVPQKEVK